MNTKEKRYIQDLEDSEIESPTITYLLSKQKGTRKQSLETDTDRPNFCCKVNSQLYTVTRVFIDCLKDKFVKLYYTKFSPKKKIGQICIMHGQGETTDDYLTMAEHFAREGYVIHIIDMRGFGYSGGERANQPIQSILSDVEYVLRFCCQRNLQTFIIGQGIGAMLLNGLLQQNPHLPISGVIFISPIIKFMKLNEMSSFDEILVKFHHQMDHLQIANLMNITALVRKPEIIKRKIQSCFSNQLLTLKTIQQYQNFSQKVIKQSYKFCYPLLVVRGDQDFLQDGSQIDKFLSQCSSEDKQIKVYPDGYHYLHIDYESEEVRQGIRNWMQERKQKILWKKMKPFYLDSLRRVNYGRRIGFMVIGFIISLVWLLKRLRKCRFFR